MDMVQMGEFLATLRKEKKWTQAELGEKLGVTNKTVSRWETGNYLPPVEMLEQLSELYGLTINELLCGKKLEQEEFQEVAEENIKAALAACAFDLKEKIAFFKKKWLRENKARLALGGIIWLAVLIVLKFQGVQPAVPGGTIQVVYTIWTVLPGLFCGVGRKASADNLPLPFFLICGTLIVE